MCPIIETRFWEVNEGKIKVVHRLKTLMRVCHDFPENPGIDKTTANPEPDRVLSREGQAPPPYGAQTMVQMK